MMGSPDPSFTRDTLLSRFDDDIGLAGELAEVFLAEAPNQIAAIERALSADDAEAVAWAAHTFKGSSGVIGAETLIACALGMEQAARAGDLPRAREAGAGLGAAWAEVRRVLQTFVLGC